MESKPNSIYSPAKYTSFFIYKTMTLVDERYTYFLALLYGADTIGWLESFIIMLISTTAYFLV